MQFRNASPLGRVWWLCAALCGGYAATACTGSVAGNNNQDEDDGSGGGAGGNDTAPPGDPPVAAACSARTGRPAWQISTNTAFAATNIVAQVFGPDAAKDAQVKSMLANLPVNLKAKGFDTENKAIAAQFVDGYVALAARLATLASEQASVRGAIESFLGTSCNQTTDLEGGCGQEVARKFADAFEREPVASEDFDYIVQAYKANKAKYQAPKAYAGFLASVMLSAKSALRYDNAELTMAGTIDAATMGSRLAMTLTSALPDQALREKIADGSILKAEVRKDEAKRLLRTDLGRQTLRHFAEQWLNLSLLKSPPGAPSYVATNEESALVAAAARQEVGALFENVVLKDGGTLRDFMSTDDVVPGHDWLAKLYGASKSNEVKRAGATDRHGLLTRVAFSLHGAYGDYLPIAHRGYGVKVTMLCGTIGALPDKVDTTLPTDAPDVMSSRQFFEKLTERGSCIGCHAAMNPYGYAMSAFSVTGARLAKEQVKNRKTLQMVDVDVREQVNVPVDTVSRSVADASALSDVIGDSDQAAACFAHRFDQFAVGVKEDFLCSDDEKAPSNTLSLQDTILDYVTSSAFSAR